MNDWKDFLQKVSQNAEENISFELADRFNETLRAAVLLSAKGKLDTEKWGDVPSDIDKEKAWQMLETEPLSKILPREACSYIRAHIDYYEELKSGKLSAMYLLFPNGQTDVAEKIYGAPAINRYMNRIVAEIIRKKCDEGFTKILEVGGGVGATTIPTLEKIKGMQFSYHFTDVSRFFLNAMEKKHPEVITGILDLDHISESKSEGKFDVILAAGVLNAIKNIPETVKRLMSLLEKNGIMIITEPTAPHIEIDVSQSFIMQNSEDFRKDLGRWYLTEKEWTDIFANLGYVTEMAPNEDSVYDKFGYHLFVIHSGNN
ncbi:MAG: class I SAM-dependent methyltransferase [Butyrivibrio sp.]|nr:class I SAM-dependent methyltransferase [Butyrivibrio sp.]